MRLNPHVHAVFLDGVYRDAGDRVTFHPLGRLSTNDVERVLEDAVARMTRYLRRRGLLDEANAANDTNTDSDSDKGSEASGLAALACTAVSGMTPPAGPVWRRGALPSPRSSQDFTRHLAVGRSGFTLHGPRARARRTSGDARPCYCADNRHPRDENSRVNHWLR